jgi:hypothetical protein
MARRGDGIYQRGGTWWFDFTHEGERRDPQGRGRHRRTQAGGRVDREGRRAVPHLGRSQQAPPHRAHLPPVHRPGQGREPDGWHVIGRASQMPAHITWAVAVRTEAVDVFFSTAPMLPRGSVRSAVRDCTRQEPVDR